MTQLDDLPEDVLFIILSNLTPGDYLAFCQICRPVYAKHRQEPFYWRTTTAATFRLPISPLLAADGPRWYSLYKKLATQTKLYTWGQGLKGNLGHGVSLPTHHRPPPPFRGLQGRAIPRAPHRPPPRQIFQRTSSSWPTEAHVPDEVGVIADLQCGGWSTTILSSSGKLFTTGALDSLNGITVGETSNEFKRLEYLTQSTSAIHQFSSGRRHVLALTDDGEIISWDRINAKGLKPFSRDGRDFGGRPTRIAAGWGLSSAYIPETGIVYWTPIKNDQADDNLDGLHIKEKIIPKTNHNSSDQGHFEVVKHIVLSNFIVWITSDSKLWACHTEFDNEDSTEPKGNTFEVPGYATDGRELKDVQGQFETFGVFTASGEVLAGSVDYLNRCADAVRNNPELLASGNWSSLTTLLASRPRDIPALQHAGVVALAYGDYHYHALHASGSITTYGRDSQCCGQLGLSDPLTGGRFRGLRRDPTGRDGMLHPIAEIRGRQIWFEPEKKDWLQWMENELKRKDFNHEGGAAVQAWDDWDREGMFSEWVEQEGRNWGDGPNGSGIAREKKDSKDSYEDLDPYFTIAIAAAGWHSGALVLVDEEKAHEVRDKWVKKNLKDDGPRIPGAFESRDDDEEYLYSARGFPKVQLPSGYMMPGQGGERTWREGMPSTDDLGMHHAP